MAEHLLHEAIGGLLDERSLPRVDIFQDSACQPGRRNRSRSGDRNRITLHMASGPDRIRMCDVDILATRGDKGTVIIEIEESNLKPVQIFGKFFVSAHSTHHGESRIDERPLLFIQVLGTSALKLERTKKLDQWKALQALIKKHAADWAGRKIFYEPFEGGLDEFKEGSNEAKRLIDMIQVFLCVAG